MKRLKGSTLIEILIAMLVISISSTLFLSIYEIMNSQKSGKDVGYSLVIVDAMFQEMVNTKIENRTMALGDLRFEASRKEIELKGLVEISINVIKENKVIYGESRIIIDK